MDHELEPGNLLVLMPMLLGINIDMKGPGWNVKKTLNTLDWSPAYNFVGAARVTMCFSVNCLRPLLIHDATRAYAFATYASVYYSYAFFSFFGFLLIPGVESLDFGGGGRKLALGKKSSNLGITWAPTWKALPNRLPVIVQNSSSSRRRMIFYLY